MIYFIAARKLKAIKIGYSTSANRAFVSGRELIRYIEANGNQTTK